MLLKQGDDLLVGRNRLPLQDTTLGLIDDLRRQVPVMTQFSGADQTGKVGEPIRLLQGHLGVMRSLASDFQQIPIRSLTTLASVVSDLPTAPFGAAPVIPKDEIL